MGDPHALGLGAVNAMAEDPAAVAAVGVDPALAVVATPAGGDTGDQYRVSGFYAGDAVTHGLHHTHAFVAENTAGLASGNVTLEDVQVGATDGGMGDADHRIRGLVYFGVRPLLPCALAGAFVD
mmetsp:Transcript_1092/g.1982  ORF Transcript_1092/g.1982 Transcript_1092/m.1982 type:complete len:124 (+) Transcript_1092:2681-3052(+)